MFKTTNKRKFVKPKAIDISQREIVREGQLQTGEMLPLLIQPNVSDVDLKTWYLENKDRIEENVLKYGGVLFRGFNIKTSDDFYDFINSICTQPLSYKEGATPRSAVKGKVYTSTEFPPEEHIALHNELSYVLTWPKKIWFSSIIGAKEGGETPIADVRKVYQFLEPSIREKFEEKGWMLVRNYGDGFGQPWQYVFHTESQEEVEKYCKENGMECEWKENGMLRTRQVRPAVTVHPDTEEKLWFNHIAFWHKSSLKQSVREMLLKEFGEEGLPYNTYYGDGTPIEDEVVAALRQAYDKATVAFPWVEGDVLVLDNMLVAHGRNPYKGERKTLVAMGEPTTRNEMKKEDNE
ncbi:TauD/TfdA family dioxygenase [Bacillus spongiae]|uniref:TauD/TfdA family dioxygenase n=1 Tax=Bacillus spongiae TaxID=2683610 RepID=A0ABU8HHT4_9BACI